MTPMKVTTCCYCGTRATLVLKGDLRHELACANCGAPISRMKMLRNEPVRVTAPAATPTRPEPKKQMRKPEKSKRNRPKKKSNFSRLGKKLFEEVWDVVEDIFD